MDNLKYYNDSFAYDFKRFETAPKKKAEIHDYPVSDSRISAEAQSERAARALLVRNIVIAVIIVITVFASLFLRAEISSMRRDINQIKSEIVELESENTRLSVEMEKKISITNLEAAAIELGMQKCEKSQVTYIQTNKVDTADSGK